MMLSMLLLIVFLVWVLWTQHRIDWLEKEVKKLKDKV